MLGDVAQTQLARTSRGEVAHHQVFVDRRRGFLAVAAALLSERPPPSPAASRSSRRSAPQSAGRRREPPIVGLTSDLQQPARQRDSDPVGGQLADERLHHSRQMRLVRGRRGPAQHLGLLLEQLDRLVTSGNASESLPASRGPETGSSSPVHRQPALQERRLDAKVFPTWATEASQSRPTRTASSLQSQGVEPERRGSSPRGA